MLKRDVGSLGEATLDTWAADIGAASQAVSRDLQGWDRLLELKWSGFDEPFDQRSGTTRILVQVKSSDSKPKSWQIKLSNLESMVKDPSPTFFLLLHFDSKPLPQRAYLVHVDNDLMWSVLKRLREASKNRVMHLHAEKMTVKFQAEHMLSEPTGASFLEAIKRAVDTDIHAYQERKLRSLKRLGYEGQSSELRVSFPLPKDHQRGGHNPLVDIVLGRLTSIDEARIEAYDTRFNIPLLDSEFSSEKASLKFLPTSQTVQLDIKRFDGTENVILEGQLLSTAGINNLIPPEAHAFRVTTSFLEFCFSALSGTQLNMTFETELKYKLSEILTLAQIFTLFESAAEDNEELELCISEPVNAEGNIVPASIVNSNPNFEQISVILKDFSIVIKASEVDLTEQTTLETIFRQSLKLRMLSTLLNGEKLAFNYEVSIEDDIDNSRTHVAVLPVAISVGQTSVIGILLLRGVPVTVENSGSKKRINLKSSNIELVRLKHMKTDVLTDDILQNLQKRATRTLNSEHTVIYADELLT